MSTVTENDLKRLEDLITHLGDNLSIQMKTLQEGQKSLQDGQKSLQDGQKSLQDGQKSLQDGQKSLQDGQKILEIGQAKIEARLEEWKPSINKISDLSEKVGELKNWKQIGVVVITAFISSILSGIIGGIIGWLIRSAKFNH